MKTCSHFYRITLVMMLVAGLLPQGATIYASGASGGSYIPFTEHSITSDFTGAESAYATDVDGDGDTDILGAAWLAIAWWENDGDENFTEHTIAGSGAGSVYATDMDGDGDVDVLGASYANAIAWWENDGDENFAKHTIAGSFGGAGSVYATDVDGDGDTDVLGAADYADDITWWENDGDENFTQHTIASSFDGAKSVYATDVDGDGDTDVLGAANFADDITWWENDGDENFTEHTIASDFTSAESVYATDVDGDGDIDILGAAWLAIAWWENDGDENFTEHTIAGSFGGAKSVYATDVDGDGDTDVLGASGIVGDIIWWENDGDENFAKHTIADNFDGAESVYATDVDGDGDADVVGAANFANDITWWEQGPPPWVVFLPVLLKNAGPPSSPPVLDDIYNPGGYYQYVVSWSAVNRATSYTLEEDDNDTFSNPGIAYTGPNTSTSVYVGYIGTYYYRVKASNELGSSEWSNVRSVVVTIQPTGPEPGHYTGMPSVSFDVTTDQQVCNFDIRVPFSTGFCRIRPGSCAEIADNDFAFSQSELGAIYEINGTFDTKTHALGSYWVLMCGSVIVSPPSEGTWEASK